MRRRRASNRAIRADRADEALLSIVPKNRRRPFDARKLVAHVVDRNSFFEIAPKYGRSRVTGLARFDGYPVGIMANNPMFNGGATDVAAGSKAMRLIQLCNTFHLPLISLADEPGFQVGLDAEKQGIERAGARLVSMVCLSEMPWCTVVIGRLYGGRGTVPSPPIRDVSAVLLAVGDLGFDAHLGRSVRRVSTGNRQRCGPRCQTPGDRSETERDRLAVPNGGGDRSGHHRSTRDAQLACASSSRTRNARWPASSANRRCRTFPERRSHACDEAVDPEREIAQPLTRRMVDRVGDGRRRAHDADLADALDAERVDELVLLGNQDDLHVDHISVHRHEVVGQVGVDVARRPADRSRFAHAGPSRCPRSSRPCIGCGRCGCS